MFWSNKAQAEPEKAKQVEVEQSQEVQNQVAPVKQAEKDEECIMDEQPICLPEENLEADLPQLEEPPQVVDLPAVRPMETYAEIMAHTTALEKEIEELKLCIPSLMADIARIASEADTNNYIPSLDCIESKLYEARAIDDNLKAKAEEIEKEKEKHRCCVCNFRQANRFCGTCGRDLGETGKSCPNCQARNKEDNVFCRNCGAEFKPPATEKECQFPGCGKSYPVSDEGDYCPECDERRRWFEDQNKPSDY